eukprot:2155200-Heterocapsa_arctica.AAC.1
MSQWPSDSSGSWQHGGRCAQGGQQAGWPAAASHPWKCKLCQAENQAKGRACRMCRASRSYADAVQCKPPPAGHGHAHQASQRAVPPGQALQQQLSEVV